MLPSIPRSRYEFCLAPLPSAAGTDRRSRPPNQCPLDRHAPLRRPGELRTHARRHAPLPRLSPVARIRSSSRELKSLNTWAASATTPPMVSPFTTPSTTMAGPAHSRTSPANPNSMAAHGVPVRRPHRTQNPKRPPAGGRNASRIPSSPSSITLTPPPLSSTVYALDKAGAWADKDHKRASELVHERLAAGAARSAISPIPPGSKATRRSPSPAATTPSIPRTPITTPPPAPPLPAPPCRKRNEWSSRPRPGPARPPPNQSAYTLTSSPCWNNTRRTRAPRPNRRRQTRRPPRVHQHRRVHALDPSRNRNRQRVLAPVTAANEPLRKSRMYGDSPTWCKSLAAGRRCHESDIRCLRPRQTAPLPGNRFHFLRRQGPHLPPHAGRHPGSNGR